MSALKRIYESKKSILLSNILWLFFDKFLGAFLTLYIYSKLAIYLGKEVFGVWNYIVSFSTIIIALGSLGSNHIIVRRLRRNSTLKKQIIFNAFTLRGLSSVLALILILLFYFIVGVNSETNYIAAIVFIFISQVVINVNVFIFWNESILKNKWTVINRNIALIISFSLKLLGIYLEKDISYFALINLIEALLFLILLSQYPKRIIKITKESKINNSIIFPILRESLPLLLSAVVVTLYLKIDQLIIGVLMSNEDLAVYATASKLTEFLYAVPAIISNVFFPKIIDEYKINKRSKVSLKNLFAITSILAILIITFVLIFSDNIITFVFGKQYINASAILSIYIWSLLFMGFQVTSSKYLLTIKKGNIIFIRGFFGLVTNVALNFIFIPKYGLKGAAWATLISYFVSSYGSNIFFKELRPIMKDQIAAIFFYLKKIKHNLKH